MNFYPAATHSAFAPHCLARPFNPDRPAPVTQPPRKSDNAVTSTASNAASPTRSTQLEMSARPKRVLVVDDDDAIRHLLTRALRRAAYDVETVDDGEAGWAAMCAGSFDLLITDHIMPRLKGVDLLRRLRANSFSLPVILISGCMPCDETDLAALLRPGMALEKPFSLVEILGNVGSLLIPTTGAGTFCNGQTSDESEGNQLRPVITRAAG